MREFYSAIAEVYEQTAQAIPACEGNPCGSCRSCCTSAIGRHQVGKLELDALAEHMGSARVLEFRRYLERETGPDGSLVYTECPNLGPQGCEIHPYRPLSCRLYGHYRAQSSPLFEHCVFRGTEQVFPDDQERLMSPGNQRLVELTIEYLSYLSHPVESCETPLLREPQTLLEEASHHQFTGNYPAAIELLLRLRATAFSPNVLHMLAACYDSARDYASARDVWQDAIAASPRNPELHLRKGNTCLQMGDLAAARVALETAVELAPERRNAQGLLGFVCQLSGDLEQARYHLTRAVELEDQPGPFRFQLALVLQSLGRLEESRAMLARAREYPPTEQQARQLSLDL